jgi:hypothetical protein
MNLYVNIAWTVTSALQKVILRPDVALTVSNFVRQVILVQLDGDSKIVELVNAMDDTYSFVDATKTLPEEIKSSENIIMEILAQTVECVVFIREYSGHGFGGE